MRAMELIRVIAVHAADKIRRVVWELPFRSRFWTPRGIGQLLSLAIVKTDCVVEGMLVGWSEVIDVQDVRSDEYV
jgi:hypothetical protein